MFNILDGILNKVSKYLQKDTPGRIIPISGVEDGVPKQIKITHKFHNWSEEFNQKELTTLLGVNPVTTPWCAAFVNVVEKMCGRTGTGKMLARSYLTYGKPTGQPALGDIVVFKRGNSSWQGHVGYYVSESSYSILVLGGNQSNKVCYKYYQKADVLGYRRPGVSENKQSV